MHQRITGTLLTLALLGGGAVANQAPSPAMPCDDETEILSIAPHAAFAAIGRSDGAPAYEVKYRYCERVHRMLIQLPEDATETRGGRFQPIFF